MENTAIATEEKHLIVELVEYVPNSIIRRTVMKKVTGSVTASSFDEGKEFCEKVLPYECYVQIIDGEAELVINEKSYIMKLGEGMIIPAHATHCFYANVKFKMIVTIIKSGYED